MRFVGVAKMASQIIKRNKIEKFKSEGVAVFGCLWARQHQKTNLHKLVCLWKLHAQSHIHNNQHFPQ